MFIAHNRNTSHTAQTNFRSQQHQSRSPPLHKKKQFFTTQTTNVCDFNKTCDLYILQET